MREIDVAVKSHAIIERLISAVPWHDVYSLSTYYPAEGWNEVDTRILLKDIWHKHPKIVTAGLRVLPGGLMENVVISPRTEWRKHKWGMSEPWAGQVLDADHKFDVVIMPALGFDSRGYRIGYGGGYYDKFLAGQPDAQKIALAYSGSEVVKVPHEPHDIPADRIITEERIIEINHVDK